MTHTVTQIQSYLGKYRQELLVEEKEIRDRVKRMAKIVEKGKTEGIRHEANMISSGYKRIDQLTGFIAEWEDRLKVAQLREEGHPVLVDYLEEIFFKDMEWWRDLVADYQEKGYKEYIEMVNKGAITKTTLVLAKMSQTEAEKTFRQDLHMRYQKLVKQVEAKVGQIQDLKIQRNPNYSMDGVVVGDKGTARISTIIAGGYNIQRLHYRTLVK